MRNSPFHISLLIGVLFLFLQTNPVAAFQKTGVIWNAPDAGETQQAVSELETFQRMGVDALELQHPVQQSVLEALRGFDFEVFIRSGQEYLTLSELDFNADDLREQYTDFITRYRTYPFISGLGVVSNSPLTDPEYLDAFRTLLMPIEGNSGTGFYFYLSDEWRSFQNPDQSFGLLFPDQQFASEDLIEFDRYMILHEVQENNSDILFMHSEWLLPAIQQYPELANSLNYFDETGEWILPLPEEPVHSPDFEWTVLVLLSMWLLLAVHLVALPSYRAFISRYFGAHSFWVEDILQYRERSAISGFILVMQHAVFGGIVFFMLAKTSMTETGINGFFHQYPFLGVTGANAFSFFVLGTVSVLFIQCIALAWIYFASEILHRFSQVLNLYTGIFHLDFLIVTIMVVLFLSGAPWYLVFTCGVLYMLIWYLAFNIAAFDASQNMIQQRGWYLFYTIGLHSVLFVIALVGLLVFTNLIEVLHLAIYI